MEQRERLEEQSGLEFDWRKIIAVVFGILLEVCYLGAIIYACTRIGEADFESKAKTIILQCVGGMVVPLVPWLLKTLFRIRISSWLNVAIQAFALFAIFLGEALEFYYLFPWWDRMLHFLSGFGVPLIAYALLSEIYRDEQFKGKRAILLAVALLSSLAVGLIWEIYEYTADSLLGTNMQKFIPEDATLFNGGYSNIPLNGTAEEIAAFFRTPEGYRYALEDTMGDMIMCASGALTYFAVWGIDKASKKEILSTGIEKVPKSL